MFKTLSGLTDKAFWRVSADTKTCGSPLYLPRARGFAGYVKRFSNKSQQKTAKKVLYKHINSAVLQAAGGGRIQLGEKYHGEFASLKF